MAVGARGLLGLQKLTGGRRKRGGYAQQLLASLSLGEAQTLPPLPRVVLGYCGPYPFSARSSHMPHLFFQETLRPEPTDTAHLYGPGSLPSAQWMLAYPSSKTQLPCPWAWWGQLRQALHRLLPQALWAQEPPVLPLIVS